MNNKPTHLIIPIDNLSKAIKRMDEFLESHPTYECISTRSRKEVYKDLLTIYKKLDLSSESIEIMAEKEAEKVDYDFESPEGNGYSDFIDGYKQALTNLVN